VRERRVTHATCYRVEKPDASLYGLPNALQAETPIGYYGA